MIDHRGVYAGLWLVVWTLGSVAVLAAEPAANADLQTQIGTLVRQLGDSSFQRREEATQELTRIGLTARSAMLTVRDDPDAEIRDRARRILAIVERADLERRIAEFLADTEDKQQNDIPGWKHFREAAGSNLVAHEYFAGMLRAETELLSALDGDAEQLQQKFVSRLQAFQWMLQRPRTDSRQPTIPLESMATLIFVASDPKVTIKDNISAVVYSLMQESSFLKSIDGNAGESIERSLLRPWLIRGTEGMAVQCGLSLSMKYNLKEEGLALAEMAITNAGPAGVPPQAALMAIDRFGSTKHVQILEPLLENKTVLWTRASKLKQQEISGQVRDLSLAAMVGLTGQDLAGYGFKSPSKDGTLKDRVILHGFFDDTERDVAVAKWRTWKAAQPVQQNSIAR